MNPKAEWGIVGMGVMGTSLSRNFASKGFPLALFNRHLEGVEEKVALHKQQLYPELHLAQPFEELVPFISALASPRKIFLMLPAGKPTSLFLKELTPLLDDGDILIDGGNTHYQETEAREKALTHKVVLFLGVGVSGGEEGALRGPSLMAGGNEKAWGLVKDDLIKIAAKNSKGNPCCAFFGSGGAGHFVKMVHNGIEYAEMQLLAEIYSLLQLRYTSQEIQQILEQWITSSSKSYLLEITATLLSYQEGNEPFVNFILDQASNKGTGAWASTAGISLGYPNTMMSSALQARYVSSMKVARIKNSKKFKTPTPRGEFTTEQIKKCYDLSRWINHHQGFEMLTVASKAYHWELNLSEVAAVWAEGCIIKSDLMDTCITLFQKEHSLLQSDPFKVLLDGGKEEWKIILQQAVANEVSLITMQSAWSYFIAIKTEKSSANIIQAQRDYFGAHGFHRIDQLSDDLLHGPWSQSTS